MASYNHTIVRNVSGVAKFFSFLGGNGLELASSGANADYAHPGDLFDRWKDDPIQFAALQYALANNLLEIIKTPDNYYFDATATRVRRIGVDNGAVVVSDPDFGSYVGAISTA